ncbi:hypothetical protein BK662_12590 [Pseudomonas frederiksbergensis]|uniref:Spermidine/putrescine ABC transporter n=2 Tax=Pseudomonas frederiksbergensis TaxID=104087 RepID=A0A423HR33_9PSED|nr:hypothetical protein BK662_12590 [Pseudomonas frederiksbergensis]
MVDVMEQPLHERIRILRDIEFLDEKVDSISGYMERFLSSVMSELKFAFSEFEERSLYSVHRSLFLLYELQVIDPAHSAATNQYSVFLQKVKSAIESSWLASQAVASFVEAEPIYDIEEQLVKLYESHPVTNHRLFDYLRDTADMDQLISFFKSDCALNNRFFDLIVLTLVGARPNTRVEISKNIWDEAGQGNAGKSHVELYNSLLVSLDIDLVGDDYASLLSWQGLEGYNLFMMGALNRQHYFKLLGIMAMTEMLDPQNYDKLISGCRRLGVCDELQLAYYEEHAEIDILHAKGWVESVVRPIVKDTPSAGQEIYIGAKYRLDSCNRYYDYLLNALESERASRIHEGFASRK